MIYTWYTTGNPYEALAMTVLDDAKKLGLQCEAIAVDPLNSWDEACGYKSKVAKKIMNRNTGPFWLIDADSRIEAAPVTPAADFAGHWFMDVELQGSVLFFADTDPARKLIQRWDELNIQNAGKIGDQLNLMQAVKEAHGLAVERLPPQYAFIYDLSRDYYGDLPGVVFRQTQASRRFKSLVTKPGFINTCQVCVPR
jgi:hypothetical protein